MNYLKDTEHNSTTDGVVLSSANTYIHMNKQDRKDLREAIIMLLNVQDIIDDVRIREQEKFDNLSEGLQQTERGQAFEAASSELEEVWDAIGEMVERVEEVMEGNS